MEEDKDFWKNCYLALVAENRKMKQEIQTLKQTLSEQTTLISQLKEELETHKKTLKPNNQAQKDLSNQQLEKLARSICVGAHSIKTSLGASGGLKLSHLDLTPLTSLEVPKPDTSLSKTDLEGFSEIPIFLQFMISGVDTESFSPETTTPKVIYHYPQMIEVHASQAVPDFAFPAGVSVRGLRLTDSASEINEIIYSQSFGSRGPKHYVFTLKSEERLQSQHWGVLDTIYCCCLQVEDIAVTEDQKEYIVPKVYSVLSYFPYFALHYEVLHKILQYKRMRRIEKASENYLESSLPDLHHISKVQDITESEYEMLHNCLIDYNDASPNSYFEKLIPGSNFKSEEENQTSKLSLSSEQFMQDLQLADLPWLCGPLFSKLRYQDFFWVLSALLLEKSVVVVGEDFGAVTSVVLGLRALMRPFKWPHVLTPLIPDSLRELLEAPLPILMGMPSPPPPCKKSYSNIVWVVLDQPLSKNRVEASKEVVKQVKEPYANNFKETLKFLYKEFNSAGVCYTPSEKQTGAILQIAKCLKTELEEFCKLYPHSNGELFDSKKVESCVNQAHPADKAFLSLFLRTQIFASHVEGTA